MATQKPPMTIDELLASDDPEDAKLLEDLWLTGGDPNYDPNYDPNDEEDLFGSEYADESEDDFFEQDE
jgi:hypothetical protein